MKSHEQIELIFKMVVLSASGKVNSYPEIGEGVLASADWDYKVICKDLEKLGAMAEMVEIEKLAEYLQAEMGLSSVRSMEFARLIFNFLKTKNQRSISADDADYILNNIFGVNFKALKEAIEFHISGNSKDYNKIMERAAGLNGISVEHMGELMKDFVLSVWCRRAERV